MKTSGGKHIPWRNMANILRLVSRRNLFNFNNISCRELYSYQTICQKSSVGVEFKDAETISKLKADKKHGLDLTFSSAEEAFRSKKTSELIRALLVFNLCSVDLLVNNNRQVSTNYCFDTNLVEISLGFRRNFMYHYFDTCF